MIYRSTAVATRPQYMYSLILGCVTIVGMPIAHIARAEQVPAQPAAGNADSNFQLEEVIVTARRKEEDLEDVPQTVTVVTAAEIENLNILQASDLDTAVAGLQMTGSGNGATTSMRGVTFQVVSQSAPTVALYLNDAPTISAQFFNSIFDIGQFEVLRGPQGTLHGESSPSGAITFTTRKPDLDNFGGYADATVTDLNAHNIQGGINFPLIQDKLAIRLAAVDDENEGNGVRSVHSAATPDVHTDGARISIRFEPTDTFSANVMYQRLFERSSAFNTAVFGAGAPGGLVPGTTTPAPPAGYNGPVIGPYDLRSVSDQPSIDNQMNNEITGQLTSNFAGQSLTYVGSYQGLIQRLVTGEDSGNSIPGYEPYGAVGPTTDDLDTHELRLSSVERVAGIFDYVVGVFHKDDRVGINQIEGQGDFLAGAFGSPLLAQPAIPGPPNTRYLLDVTIGSPHTTKETSFFGNLTAHLTDKLEISGGARYIDAISSESTTIRTTPAFIGLALPASICGGIGGQYAATYAGVCDVPIPANNAITPSTSYVQNKPVIYDASVSYHFTPDLMAYAQTGSSWIQGPYIIGINNATNDAALNNLTNLSPEKSKSYEVGLKWTFLDRRGRLNLDYYHQTYDGLIYASPFAIHYLSYTGAPTPTVATYPFISNAPAVVDGVDLDTAFEFTKYWSASGNFSWADGRLTNASIPCNDGNFDGVPDSITPTVASFTAAGKTVAYCKSSTGSSTAPKWNFNVQSEYDLPINAQVVSFLRGLLAYQTSNPNANQGYVIPAYATLNVYAGVHDPKRLWEVTAFAKNITDTQKIVSLASSQITPDANLVSLFGSTGYTAVALNPRREIGLNVHYVFGAD